MPAAIYLSAYCELGARFEDVARQAVGVAADQGVNLYLHFCDTDFKVTPDDTPESVRRKYVELGGTGEVHQLPERFRKQARTGAEPKRPGPEGDQPCR